jgi:hypothetical protein
MTTRSAALAISLTGVALVAAGCSSSGSSPAASTAPTEAPTEAATPTPTPTEAAATPKSTEGGSATLPKAPAGAELQGDASRGGNEYARYKISMPPKKVVNKYKKQAKADGYTISSAGGSGGGWGGYGGSNYGMTAKKGSGYLEVQAGGESGAPTYYEVCVSANGSEAGLRHCDNESNQDSNEDSRSRRS